jgi:LysM repeat protein
MPYCPPGSQQFVIKPGDNFWSLSHQYGVSHADIIALNPGVDPNRLKVGQVICIPTNMGPSVPNPSNPYTGYWQHFVASGDTIWDLSRRYNVPYDEILRHNPGIDHMHLRPGQAVHIPHR